MREWLPAAAFLIIVLALIVLAVIPTVLLQRVSRMTQGIATTVLPMDDGLRDFAFAQEQRASASRGQFLTGDPRYGAQLAEARATEAASLRALESLAPRLGVGSVGLVESLRAYVARRDSLEAVLVRDGTQEEAYREALPRFDVLRDSMLAQVQGLRRELARVTEARVAEEARWADLQRRLSAVVGVVALLAALLVGWFAWRQRRLTREIQRALEEANRLRLVAERRGEELERASEARARLLRGVTHDVKNPLGAAKGYAELLEMEIKSPLLPEQRPFLEGIRRSVDGALAILGDLLDLARADSGGLSVNRVEVDLRAVAREAAEDHRSAAEAAGHSIDVRLPAEELGVLTDPSRVGQVLGNLLSNAIKYTPPPGRITVGCDPGSRDGAPLHGAWATVRVSDSGPGIPPEQREAIFDEFTRLEDGGGQKGHGLGLAIARRIARMLGGDLTVEDGPGGGASFVLWLPMRDDGSSTRETASHGSRERERL